MSSIIFNWVTMWQNVPSDIYAQSRPKSACESSQSSQSFHCRHEVTLNYWLFKQCLVNSLTRLREYAGWSESSLGAYVRKYHNENTPIQIYWNFHHQKNEIFQIKNSDILNISVKNIDCWYSLEPSRRGGSNEYRQYMFWAEIRKIIYTPVNPSFTI